jgi:heparanase 1
MDGFGILAQNGHRTFCRQTLIGGNYGLLNTTTHEPNPE